MRLIQVIIFLILGMVANGAKVTWNENGKPEISESKHLGKGCQMDSLLSLEINATLLMPDVNVSKSCT